MKQKLLFSLLALLVSVGMVSAQQTVTFNAPTNSGDITVTLGSVTTAVTITSSSGLDVTKPTTETGTSVKYTLKNNDGSDATWTITGDDYVSLTISSAKKSINGSVTIANSSVKTTKLVITGEAITAITGGSNITELDVSKNKITSGDFSSFNALTKLTCNDNAITGNLKISSTVKTLTCGGNAIVDITDASSAELFDTHFSSLTFGTQVLAPSSIGDLKGEKANDWFDLLILVDDYALFPTLADNKAKPTFAGFMKSSDNASMARSNFSSTTNAKKHSVADFYSQYQFYSTNQYEPGLYLTKVTTADKNYSKRAYEVLFMAKPAVFSLKKVFDDTKGGLAITGNTGGTDLTTQGDLINLVATPNGNNVFDKFVVTGTKTPSANESSVQVEVVGPKPGVQDQSVIVEALFKAIQSTVTLETAKNGTYAVRIKDGATVATNGKVDYGVQLQIIPTPAEGYVVDKVFMNSEEVSFADDKYITSAVSAENTIISVTFKLSVAGAVAVNVNVDKTIFTDSDDNAEVTLNTTPLSFSNGLATQNVQGTKTLVLKVAPKNGKSILIRSVTLDNKIVSADKIKRQSDGSTLITISLDEDVTTAVLTLEAVLQGVLDLTKTVKEQAYDFGTKPSFVVTTNPSGVSGITVLYTKESMKDGENWKAQPSSESAYTTTVPTNAGFYYVVLKRAADESYAEIPFSVGQGYKFVINQGKLALTPPTSMETETSGGVLYYKRTGGSAKFNDDSNVTGTFVITKARDKNGANEKAVEDNIVPTEYKTVAHYVDMTFTPTSATDKNNYAPAVLTNVAVKVGSDEIASYAIKATSLPSGVSKVRVRMGDAEFDLSSTTKLADKAEFELVFVTNATTAVTKVIEDVSGGDTYGVEDNVSDPITINGKMFVFKLQTEKVDAPSLEFDITLPKDDTQSYDGTVKTYTKTPVIKLSGTDTNATNPELVYTYELDGKTVISPSEAGQYVVKLTATPTGDDAKTHKKTTATGTFIIKKAPTTILSTPTASKIGIGQALSSSVLTGGSASVPGKFEWVDPTAKPTETKKYQIKFVPTDSKNYESALSTDATSPEVVVSDKAVLAIVSENGTITVKDDKGTAYFAGDEVPIGTKLTLTATPSEGYKLVAFKVDGKAISGSTYTMTAKSVTISAEFSQEGVFYDVKVNVGRGAIATLPTSNKVEAGKSYVFTVTTAEGDVPVVTDEDGTVYSRGTNGRYTIENILSNKTINIEVNSPTEFSITIDENEHGTLKIENLSAATRADQYFYGDTLRLTATPETGGLFRGWWDGNKTNPRIYVVKGDQKISMDISPVGIEPVEDLEVYGGEGYISVSAPGEVSVTVVSMGGRSQKLRVNGTERIQVAAGIYGIIVEKGDKASKMKIVVR